MHLGQLTLLSLSVWHTWAFWAALWWAGLLPRPQHEHTPNYWDINKQSSCDTVWPYGRLKGAFQGHRGMCSANSWASYTYQGERPGTSSASRRVRITSGLYAIYKQPQIKMWTTSKMSPTVPLTSKANTYMHASQITNSRAVHNNNIQGLVMNKQ